MRRNTPDASNFGGFRDRGVDPRDRDRPTLLDEDQLAAQLFWPFREPLVEQFLQLRVQGDVTVGVQFAQRDVQPVGRTDLHDGVGGQRQVLALAHTGSGEELDREPHERVVVGTGGLQQLGRRGVVEEPGQGFVGIGMSEASTGILVGASAISHSSSRVKNPRSAQSRSLIV